MKVKLKKFKNHGKLNIGIFVVGRNCAYGYQVQTRIIGTIRDEKLVTVFDDKNVQIDFYKDLDMLVSNHLKLVNILNT